MSSSIAHFSLWGDFAVDDITLQLGIEPSCVYHKGELWEGASHPARVSTWDMYCPPETGESMQEQLFALIELLMPKANILKQLAAEYHADLNLTADATSVLTLDREIIRKLFDLHLNVNCFFDCREADDAD